MKVKCSTVQLDKSPQRRQQPKRWLLNQFTSVSVDRVEVRSSTGRLFHKQSLVRLLRLPMTLLQYSNTHDTRSRNLHRKLARLTCFLWCMYVIFLHKFLQPKRTQLYSAQVCTRTWMNLHNARNLRGSCFTYKFLECVAGVWVYRYAAQYRYQTISNVLSICSRSINIKASNKLW